MPDEITERTIPPRATVFPLGPPVDLAYQVGRIGDIARLTEALRGRDHMVLSDVRRAGKTTAALCALDQLGADKPAPIIVSLNLHERVNSSDLLAIEIARQLAVQKSWAAQSKFSVARLASRLWHHAREAPVKDLPDPTAALIAEGAKEALEILSPDKSGVEKVSEALAAVEALADERSTQAYVFIDEVQELAGWDDADALKEELLIRFRRAGRRTTYVFAGSEPSMVALVFGNDGLLEFDAQEFFLSPVEDGLARADLLRSFEDLQIVLDGDPLFFMLTAADGRPVRMMLIANKAARLAAEVGDGVVDDALVRQAVREARKDRMWHQGGLSR